MFKKINVKVPIDFVQNPKICPKTRRFVQYLKVNLPPPPHLDIGKELKSENYINKMN